MPTILGMEPKKWIPIAVIGGGAILYFVIKSRSGGAAPVSDQQAIPAPTTVSDAGTAQAADMSQVQQDAMALANQKAALDLQGQQAQMALSLKAGEQQLQFQAAIQNQQEAQAAEATSFQYRIDRGYNPARKGGIIGTLTQLEPLAQTAISDYQTLYGGGGSPSVPTVAHRPAQAPTSPYGVVPSTPPLVSTGFSNV